MDASGEPTVDQIVADLRVLRERGLARLRHTDLTSLHLAATRTGIAAAAQNRPDGIESVMRAAVENLGGGPLGTAALATFGLGRGARDRPAQDRRRQAAMAYGVSVERFRKHHERVVMEQVAEEILKLGMSPARPAWPEVIQPDIGRKILLTGLAGDIQVPIVLHVEPVELIRDVDIVVAPSNLYLEPGLRFKSSVSAALRRAAATRGPDGQIVVDVVSSELDAWVREHGRPGLPAAPGTVAPTSPGALASQGVRRIYHVAIASPRLGTNDYDVDPTAIAQGVRNVLALARAEAPRFQPMLNSIGFPLLGAGRGGLAPAVSIAWIWSALERDIVEHGSREIHFITYLRSLADIVLTTLTESHALADVSETNDGIGKEHR